MQYLLLVYIDPTLIEALPEGEYDTMMRHCLQHADELQAEGTLLGFQQLEPASTAKAVRRREGKVAVVDGPFAETKDLIAGWMVIDVDSYDRALELAGELSAAPGPNGEPIHEWLELRPFLAEPPTVTE